MLTNLINMNPFELRDVTDGSLIFSDGEKLKNFLNIFGYFVTEADESGNT